MEPFNSPIQGYDGWNVNASYMTPSYMSNFRPRYNNEGGRPNPFAENRSVAQSAWRMGPGDHEWGRDVLQDSASDRYNITTGAGDVSVAAMQQIAIPAAAWYGASKLSNMGTMFGSRESLGSRAGARMGGMASRMATGAAGRGMGVMGMGGMAARGAGVAGSMAGGAAAVGGLAGGMFLPLMAAQAMGSVADSALIDPYVQTRRGMDAMLSNTANRAITGSGGSTSGGFGMSATRAQEISQSLTVAGQGDLMLGGGDYNEIADNMMRAGIFQEVGDMDANKIVDGVKKATSVLKLIQRVTGDPDIKAGIQTLATLKAGGLDDINQMGLAVNQLRAASAVSGVSMQQIMDTVGNQGAVMAQQQGISANTGMLASADAFAGFTNARQAGLISGTEMAMLGGAEGMTQNLMGGAYQAMNSGMGRMILQGGGQFGDNGTSNINRWGGQFAGNPLASQGDWFLNQQVYKDEAMNDVGASNIILKSLQGQARTMGQDANDGNILAALAPSLGITPEQLRSAGLADRAAQDPLSQLRMVDANRASTVSNRVTELQNTNQGLRGVWGLGTAQKAWNEGSRGLLQAGAEAMDPFTAVTAGISDAWSAGITSMKGIESTADQAFFVDQGDGTKDRLRLRGNRNVTTRSGARGENLTTNTYEDNQYDDMFTRMNTAAQSRDPEIRKKSMALRKAIQDGDSKLAAKLYSEIDNSTGGSLTGTAEDDFERRVALQEFEKAVANGSITTETDMSLDTGPVAKTIEGELAGLQGLSTADKDKAIKRLIETRSNDMSGALGISLKELGGKSEDQVKDLMLDRARAYQTKYAEIDTGDVETDKQEFMKRFQEMGYSSDQINSMVTKSGRSMEDFLKDQNSIFGGEVTDEALTIKKQIDESIDMDKRAERTKGTNIDWSNLRDVTSGIGALGDATDRNTNATNLLTDAILATNNANNGSAEDITRDQLLPPNPNESTVKGVTKNRTYAGDR